MNPHQRPFKISIALLLAVILSRRQLLGKLIIGDYVQVIYLIDKWIYDCVMMSFSSLCVPSHL